MKLDINKEKLLKGIQKTEKVVGKNMTLPVLSCILIETEKDYLKISATNLDISIVYKIPAKIEKEGKVAIPTGTINSFLSNLPKNDSRINLELKDDNIHITTESTDTVIKTQSSEDFPEIKEIKNEKEVSLDIKDFISGLNSVWYSSSISSIKPELSSVHIYPEGSDLIFVATDSFRLAEKKVKTKNSDDFESVLIPFKNVSEIIRIFDDIDEDVKVYFEEDQLIIVSEDIYIASRIIEGNFPDYKQIIPKEVSTEINVLKEDLNQTLRISNVFSDKFNQVNFSVFPEDNIFEVQATSSDVGESKNRVKSKIKGENIKINFNNKYISDCFGSIKSDAIELYFNGTDKPMIIKGTNDESFMYLVMPMNR